MHAPARNDERLEHEPQLPDELTGPLRPITGVRRVPAALRRPESDPVVVADAPPCGLREPGERDAIVPDPPA